MELLERAKGKRIAVIGDAMLDVYLLGDVERISPEAPVPVVRVVESKVALGGAANVAQNLVAIGTHCELVAILGSDPAGDTLQAMLTTIGASNRSLIRVSRRTTRKTRLVARSQQLIRFDEEDDRDIEGPELETLLDAVEVAISGADAVVLEDYNKGVLVPRVIERALAAGTRRGLPIVVDPKHRNFFQYPGATIFKPNRRELEAALGATVDLAHSEAVPAMVSRLGVQYLLLTLGDRGMVLFDEAGELARISTAARAVFDVVGAGDTVTAFLAAVLAAGGTAREAAFIANIAAGIEVGKLGAATVTCEELLEYFDTHAL